MLLSLLILLGMYGIYVLYKVLDSLLFPPKQNLKEITIPNGDVDNMTGLEFEKYCINLLIRTGRFTRAQMTNANNDYGADIVAVDNEGNRWVFQCKRYSSNLNNKPIQEVIGSMAHYKATKAAVITNSRFTENAKVLGRENGVWLIDRAGLSQLEKQAKEREEEKHTKKQEQLEQRNDNSNSNSEVHKTPEEMPHK